MNQAVTEPREGVVDVAPDEQRRRFPPDRLSTLGPRSVWLAGALFWSLIVMALALQFAEVQRWRDKIETLDPLFAEYGLVLLGEDLLFEVAPATEAAHKAGIRRGDRIIAVNGEDYDGAYSGFATYIMTAPQVAQLIRDAGTDPITFAVQNAKEMAAEAADEAAGRETEGEQYWRLVDLKRSASASSLPSKSIEMTRRWVLKGSEWTISVLLIVAAIVLWWNKRTEPVNVAVACSIAITSARIGTWMVVSDLDPTWSIALDVVFDLGSALLVMMLPALPDGRYRPLVSRWIMLGGLYILVSSLLMMALSPLVLISYKASVPFSFSAAWGVLLSARFFTTPALLLIAIGLALFKFRRTPKGPERQQVKFITLGFIAGFVALAAGFGWDVAGQDLVPEGLTADVLRDLAHVLKNLGPVFIVLGVIASQMRYRLNDVDSFISRTAAYGVVTALITTLWGSLTTSTTALLASVGGAEIASAISAMLAAAVFVPARKRVLDWTEHRFQPALVRMRSLPAKIRSLAHDHDPAEIARAALQATVKGIGAQHGAIALAERQGHVVVAAANMPPEDVAAILIRENQTENMGNGEFDASFHLRMELSDLVGPIGILLLGPRSNGAGYSSDEKEALELLKGPLSEALRATARRASRNGAIAAILERLEARIDAMEAHQRG